MDAPHPDRPPDAGSDFARRVARVGTLTEPARRRLYRYVVAQAQPVSREEAAAAVGVARHTAKFHLDRLVADGLLETHSRRLSGRSGPGAGRPSKLYLRAPGEVSVSLPERRYDLAGRLMAQAIERSTARGVLVHEALAQVAAEHGRDLARTAARAPEPEPEPADATGPADATAPHDVPVPDREPGAHLPPPAPRTVPGPPAARALCALLDRVGYEPRTTGGTVVLANCPFHALATDHTALVCGMNLALLAAAGDELGTAGARARLDPAPGRCCVVLDL